MIRLKHQGMVLLTVLLVLGLMALLLLNNLQSFFLYEKMTQAFETQDNLISQLENTGIEQLSLWGRSGGDNCVVQNLGLNTAIDHVLSRGCRISSGSIDFMYLISDLGVMPCEQIKIGSMVFGSKQGVITLATAGAPWLGLQIRMAFTVPLVGEACQSTTIHQRLAGVMSWRLTEGSDGH